MAILRLLVVFAGGFLTQQLLVFTAGFWAARDAPPGYFQRFGPEHKELALGLLSALTFALPQFLLAALVAFVAARALRVVHRATLCTYLAGAVAAVAICAFQAGLSLAAYRPQALWQVPAGPWAGWLGMLIGLRLFTLHHKRHARADA